MRHQRQPKALPKAKPNVQSAQPSDISSNDQNSNIGQQPAMAYVSAPNVQNASQKKLPVNDFSSTKGQQLAIMASIQTPNVNVNEYKSTTIADS